MPCLLRPHKTNGLGMESIQKCPGSQMGGLCNSFHLRAQVKVADACSCLQGKKVLVQLPSTFSGPQLPRWVLSGPGTDALQKWSTLCSVPVQVGSGCEGNAGRQGLSGRTGCSALNKTHPTSPTRGKRTARADWIRRLDAGGGAGGWA